MNPRWPHPPLTPIWFPFIKEGSQAVPFAPEGGERQARPRRLEVHPELPDVIVVRRHGGIDFIRFCAVHRWASVPLPAIPAECPHCLMADHEADGRTRFDQLQTALALDL